jgi:hypothetical protein
MLAMFSASAVGQITSGTIFLDPDIITPTDPTTFLGISPAGTGNRLMFDRRVNAFITLNAFLFNATYSDASAVEIQVNPEFSTVADAQVEAAKYAPVIGRLPVALRSRLQTVWIHKGVQPFGGGNNNLLIHTGQADQYVAAGILEETLVHEATHTSLDPVHAASVGWRAAQTADGVAISTYARDNPTREDVAETWLLWLAVRYRRDRITASLAQQIESTIPHRLAYLDQQSFNVAPVTRDGAGITPLGFLPIAPCRLVDTRNAAGPLGGPAIAAGGTRNFPIRSACGLPASSAAYSLNITVVPRGTLGYLSIWPGGRSQPVVSTLNSLDGRVKANAAIVPAGSDGSVNVFATDATDVILDVNGVFAPKTLNPTAQSFYAVSPCRFTDTRAGDGGVLQPQVTRTIAVASRCGIPVTATAYALNLTVVPKQTLGYLTVWPNDQSARPTVSTLNAPTGTVTANLAIVPAGAAGDINAFATETTELIVDVTGYFGPSGAPGALQFYTLDPCRVLDTRLASGLLGALGGPQLTAGSTRTFQASAGSCNAPRDAQAYSLSATVVPPAPLGYLTLYPVGVLQPLVSTLNALDGAITSNAAIVPVGTSGGLIDAYVSERTHLLLDINGYFAP